MLCEVRVLFGKLAFGFGLLQKERKGELSWFPVPTGPPLLAAARQPPLVPSVRAPVSVCICLCNCLHVTVNLSMRQRERAMPAESSLSQNASGVFLVVVAGIRVDASLMLSLPLHYYAFSWMIYLQFYRSEKCAPIEAFCL